MKRIILTEQQLHRILLKEVKKVGGRYYIHKNYADKCIPSEIYQKALEILRQKEPEFEFDCLVWSPTTPQVIEFDKSTEFGTVTEPLIDRRVKVNIETGEISEGKGNMHQGAMHDPSVWHGKSQYWVDSDFSDFDVQKHNEWRNEYLQAMKDYPLEMTAKDGKVRIQKTPVGGSRAAWLNHLIHIHKIDRYFEMNGIDSYEDKIAYLEKWSGGAYKNLVEKYLQYLEDEKTNNIIQEAIDEISFDKNFKPIDNFDLPIFADDADWDTDHTKGNPTTDRQENGSEDTSLHQVPRTFNPQSGIHFDPNTFNFDIGGGKFDIGSEALLNGVVLPNGKAYVGQQVVNIIFDPYNRTPKFNDTSMDRIEELGGADTVTVNSCLNVIQGRKHIDNVIHQAAEVLKPEGTAIFQIYDGDSEKKGKGGTTLKGFQQNKKAVKYVPLIHSWFNKLWIDKGHNCIIAQEPIINIENKAEWYPDKDGPARFLNLKR